MNKYFKLTMIGIAMIFAWFTAESQVTSPDQPLSPYQKYSHGPEERTGIFNNEDAAGYNSGVMYNDDLGNEGDIFYDKGWTTGKVGLADGGIMVPDKLCYNIYFQQMQFIDDGDTLAFAEPAELSWLELDGARFIYSDYVSDTGVSRDYFQVLNEGSCCLLKRHLITHHKEIDPYLGTKETDQFIRTCELYLKKDGQPAERIHCSKRDLCKALDDHDEILHDFMKENGIRIRSVQDLITVLDFYNGLEIGSLTANK